MIRRWLAKRPRWHVHLTPTSSSWLNQVERFFALLTDKKIRRGIYRSVAALRADITSFIDRHNADPKPFRWTKSADDILASIERFCRYNTPAKHPDVANFWFRILGQSGSLFFDANRQRGRFACSDDDTVPIGANVAEQLPDGKTQRR